MVKVSVLYPSTEGARFDHAYYRDKHMPMVKDRLGEACLYYTIEKGLAGGSPGEPPPYMASCQLAFNSVESFQAAFAPHAGEIMGDIPNYTSVQPVIQINEVVVDRA